jgi:hypothetical protein
MSFSDNAEQELLDLLFLNQNYGSVGDATGIQASGTAGSLYVALHTADPTDSGTQASSECTYTGYARVAVARSGAGWSRSTSTISNVAAVTFGACTAGSETATHFSIGHTSTGSTAIILSGALDSSLAISSGITPEFAIGDLTASID